MSTLATKLLTSKIDVLKNKILDSCALKGIDPAWFIAPEGSETPLLYPMITSSLFMTRGSDTINPVKDGDRFKKEVRFFKSSPVGVESNLWTLQNNRDFMSCDVDEGFYQNMISEVYRVDGLDSYTPGDYFVDNNLDHTSGKDVEENILAVITEHESYLDVRGIGSLIYTNISRPFMDFDSRHYYETMITSSPYCVNPTMHELFKTLLEWQWAYNEHGYDEYMAVMANDFLNALGLNYLNESTDEVVGALMSLPDQSLAQQIKTGDCQINVEEPECPAEFTAWCKGIMELITFAHDYKAVLSRL
jgi:hypothetical protein